MRQLPTSTVAGRSFNLSAHPYLYRHCPLTIVKALHVPRHESLRVIVALICHSRRSAQPSCDLSRRHCRRPLGTTEQRL
eukprot:4244402-Prymnesium_polylepis.1